MKNIIMYVNHANVRVRLIVHHLLPFYQECENIYLYIIICNGKNDKPEELSAPDLLTLPLCMLEILQRENMPYISSLISFMLVGASKNRSDAVRARSLPGEIVSSSATGSSPSSNESSFCDEVESV